MTLSYNNIGTFKDNKQEPFHRWYNYLEGYSFKLVDNEIRNLTKGHIKAVYDPFCGTGTTALVASTFGLESYYCESNPFMREVIEAKINCVKELEDSKIFSTFLSELINKVEKIEITQSKSIEWNGFENFFFPSALEVIKKIKETIQEIENTPSKKIAMVCLASILVKSSKMIRRGDLRRAKENEKKAEDFEVKKNYILKLQEIINDIENNKELIKNKTICLADDARKVKEHNLVDCIITSPPYLNGTNYIRNTKLELKLFDFISAESDMPIYHSKGIIAGINNVSKRKVVNRVPSCVNDLTEQLKLVAYDSRIPVMVAGYFQDMSDVISNLHDVLKKDGLFIMDIGDSQFAGVHVPTHELLVNIAKDKGFNLFEEQILRERKSKNGMMLSQRLLKFRLEK